MKTLTKIISGAALSIMLSSSLAVAGGKAAPSKENYEKAVVLANAALDRAASVEGEWRDARWKKSKFVKYKTPDGKTFKGSYMHAAAEAAKHGDYATAMDLLETATAQGNMGYEQATAQKSFGPRL
mgnify:CR=1 FL=1